MRLRLWAWMQLHEVWVEQGPGQCPADANMRDHGQGSALELHTTVKKNVYCPSSESSR